MSSIEASEEYPAQEPRAFGTLVPATPRELKGIIRDWRRGRATKNLGQALQDAYVAVIGALMIGAMIINVILNAQRVVASCSSVSCLSARTVLPWAAFAGAIAVSLSVSRLFGPVLASAAEGFWLLDAPISRAKLLGLRLIAAVIVAFVGGAAMGALVSALTGSGLTEVLIWSSATALSAAAAVAFAAAQQGIERHLLTRIFTYLFGVLAIAALMLVVGVAANRVRLGFAGGLGSQLGLIMIGFSGAVLVASFVLARLRLGRIHRTRLLSGGALVSGISGAFFALDVGLARDIVVARRAMELGHVEPVRGRGIGLEAIIWREWQRLRRFPQPLLVVGGTTVVPYAADALGMGSLASVFAALALFGATIPLLGGLRVLTRTGGLARCLPFSLARIKLASVTVPAIVVATLVSVCCTGIRWPRGNHRAAQPVGRCADGRRHRICGPAGRDSLDPGERRRFRCADDRHPGGRLSPGADDQPLPRIRRRPFDHRTHAARGVTIVVARARGHRGGDLAELHGRRGDADARQAEQQKLVEQQRKQRDAAKASSQQRKR